MDARISLLSQNLAELLMPACVLPCGDISHRRFTRTDRGQAALAGLSLIGHPLSERRLPIRSALSEP